MDQEEIRERVSKLLRLADESVKIKAYDKALEIVRTVFTVDLKNMYARAYEERILALKIEEERERMSKDVEQRAELRIEAELKRKTDEIYKTMEIEALKKKELQSKEQSLEDRVRRASAAEHEQFLQKNISTIETTVRKSIEELENRITSKVHKEMDKIGAYTGVPTMSMDQVRSYYESKLEKMNQQFEEAETTRRKIHEDAFLKLSEEHQRTRDEIVKQMEEDRELLLRREREKSRQLALEAYETLLALTEEIGFHRDLREPLLQALRKPFSITDEEHHELKRKIQLASYMSVLREAWQKGKPSEEDVENLKNLQNLYGISDDENLLLTRTAKKDLGLPDETAVILVVDDDPVVQEFICHTLKQTYRTVFVAKNVDEAVATTLHNQPALILCDHHLGPDSINGITFYEKIQKNTYGDSLKNARFVLMSALRNEFFLASVKNLGISALLPKPFTKESLEKTLREALH